MTKPLSLAALLLGILLLVFSARAQPPAPSVVVGDAEIRAILEARVSAEYRDRLGIVVGVIEPQGQRIVAIGSTGGEPNRPLDGDTVFEIGSITKAFTSLLLADMAERGELTLDDTVAAHLPDGVTMPMIDGKSITLIDLATHRSGLPRMPNNFTPADAANPYADYSVEQLYAFLSGYTLPRAIGAEFEYSNLGVGLLGHVLARTAGVSYEALVTSRVLGPLQMESTVVTLPVPLHARLAIGHDTRFAPTPNWDVPTLAGAGALRSTANDMLKFLDAYLAGEASPLAAAMAAQLAVRSPAGPAGQIALAWLVRPAESAIFWHNGGTGGYRSFAGFDPATQVGVVVLTNAVTSAGVDDLGLHLLDPQAPLLPSESPLLQPPRERTEISLGPTVLESYVGRYELGPNVIMTVTLEGGQLYGQLTGQPRVELYPEAEREFFLKVVDAQISFRADAKGRINALVLHQLGIDRIAAKLDAEADPIEEWFGHREATVDPSVFDRYVGRYQLAPGAVMSVTRENDRLFTQLTGQPRIQVFPESATEFFLKVVDAQITFEVEDGAKAAALVLHQAGRDLRAARIE
jgi:CubicO group peptidase (beta-lactamase class C family)